MPPVVPPFLIGLIAAPLAKRLFKPLVRGVVKTSVGLAMEVKKAAHEAGEGIQDLAAEVAAEMVTAQMIPATDGGYAGGADTESKSTAKPRPAAASKAN
ncbi:MULTISPECIES: DUF5132 domain-containing protein [unclassified Streptomyces]|uniref:DUF5132 domain-containing protein n=1 Tax=unclassified Streptomyces TaxID=2593676 RepID=UPI0037FA2C8F